MHWIIIVVDAVERGIVHDVCSQVRADILDTFCLMIALRIFHLPK